MASGTGVTIRRRGERWCVRWRERVEESESERGWRWVQREQTCSSESRAKQLEAKILRAFDLHELVELDPVRPAPTVASVDRVLEGWARTQRARGRASSTLDGHASAIARILRELRAEHRVREGEAIPGSILSRSAALRLVERLRAAGLVDGSICAITRVLLEAWRWARRAEDEYPGLPAPPDNEDVLPEPPLYVPGTPPRLAEVDAMLRHLAGLSSRVALPTAIILRYSGLRVGQVLHARVEDVNLRAGTLFVRAGKSRREKAEMRTIPLAPPLIDYLVPLVAARDPGEPLLRRRSDTRNADRRGGPSLTLRRAWEAATTAGEVRRETWQPPGRRNARPDHGIRAAVIAHLRLAGVAPGITKWLAGQAIDMQERFYLGDGAIDLAREAVAKLPEIDWRDVVPANVVRLRRA